MKTYRGFRPPSGPCVEVLTPDGDYPLPLYSHLRNHNSEFEWGYVGGSGPAQLALAVLADCLGEQTAMDYYQQFKRDVVAELPREWTLTEHAVRIWHAERCATEAAVNVRIAGAEPDDDDDFEYIDLGEIGSDA